MSRRTTALVLSALLFLFFLRVLGQALVGLGHAPFLPAWHEWYSGLLPYPWLLASQILILIVFGKACIDVWRGEGYFARPHPALGTPLLAFGWLYAASMELRYWLLRTHEVPVLFHIVLAAFLVVYALYQRRVKVRTR